MDDTACTDFDIRADEGMRMDLHACGDPRCRTHERRRTDAGKMRLPRRMKMGDDLGERRVHVADGNKGPVGRLQRGWYDYGRGLRASQMGGQPRMISQRDLSRPGDR